ncbi:MULTISPECIES: outer membrane protein assembly factor BamE domain-containing protein [Spirulina]|uniref:outer membrane protein assembly factor BamE domain-containing protein n=1 Tax=Spirulina TaxID=1154 RepID=UPI0023309126|nr:MULTISPECIES: outer membrane protein assembly factor BamE [Spirulina]
MKTSVFSIMAGIFIFAAWYVFFGVESYFFLWPSIDTQYSENYNEENFNKITIGMPKNEVDQLMGEPLSIYQIEDGTAIYSYSSDARLKILDFAWFGRSVIFRDNKVIEIEKEIYYD